MRRLLVHEARVHARPGRLLRDLDDAILLTDPNEPEPFWNRLEAVRWPKPGDAFDRRLTEALIQFSALGRRAHIWASPLYDEPADLVTRLEANGFRDMGRGNLMALADPAPAEVVALADLPPGVTVERSSVLGPTNAARLAARLTAVLLDAFDADPQRRPTLEGETASALADPWFTYYLASIDDQPAAVARRATFEGASYLSSIGTAGWARRRGLGSLLTCIAARDALVAASRWTYLGVYADNASAIAVYERAGFVRIGEPAADLVLM